MPTLEVTVDPMWTEFVTQDSDVFLTSYCGYWMRGMEQDKELGWLALETGFARSGWRTPPAVLDAWRHNRPLPKGWLALNNDIASKAWVEGVKRGGVDWYENGDAIAYDCAIQMALLGEVRYG